MNPFLDSVVAQPQELSLPFVAQTAVPCAQLSPGHLTRPLAQSHRHPTTARLARWILGVAAMGLSLTVQAVDVNTAAVDELRNIQGIGPKTAQLIVDERTRGGAYESLEDLSDRVKGIGPKKAARLGSAGLTVSSVLPVTHVSKVPQAQGADKVTPSEPLPVSRLGGFFSR